MPYANVPESKQDEMERCVKSVMGDGKDEQAAIAICYTSIVEGKSIPESIKAYEDVIKIGSRNSRQDAQRLQMIHDYARENGAACGEDESKSVDLDSLVYFGGEVKALGASQDGGLHIGGHLIRFGDATTTDISDMRDYFTPDTDYGDAKTSDVYYNHRLPIKTRDGSEVFIKRKWGTATLSRDDIGILIDAVTYNRDSYDQIVNQFVGKTLDKHGWSSGTASHLVERERQSNGSHKITRWPLGLDASLTPTPAEPRNTAQPIKSVSPSLLEIPEAAQENRDESTATAIEQPVKTNLGDQAMDNEVLDSVKALAAKVEALETTIKNAPPVKTLGNGVEVKDNEKPFKSIGEQLMAIKAQAEGKLTERQHNGIKAITADYIKATGASEAVASDGGVLLQPEFSNDLTKQTFEYGTLLGLLNVQEIGPNANSKIVNRVKETSIASTLFGGVTAYWTGEAGAYSATKPTFTQDEVKLNKVTGLYYATDELMQDATALSGEIMRMFSSAIRFKVESAVWEGNGVGMPLGITAGGSVVTQAKEGAQAADSVVYENVIKMYSRLFPMSQRANTTAWICNADVLPQLNTLVQVGGTAAIPAKFVDWGADGIMRMMGRPVYTVPYASTIGDLYDLMLIDFAWYDAISKGGMQGASSIHVAFTTGEQAFRWAYRFGGKPAIDYVVTPHKGSNTVAPFVALAARA